MRPAPLATGDALWVTAVSLPGAVESNKAALAAVDDFSGTIVGT